MNENQVLYLFSTSAQVLGAVYGLTVTGFIFFLGDLTRQESEDETLADAVASLRRGYYASLTSITMLAVLAIVMSNLVIAAEDSDSGRIVTVLINVGQSAFVTSLLALVLFTLEVVSPRKLERASRSLQDQVDPRHAEQTGSLAEFLRNFNQIETLLTATASEFQAPVISSDVRRPRRWSNVRLAEILLRSERISRKLFEELRELITLRNAIIHGADPVVSQQLVEESQRVSQELSTALRAPEAESSA